MSNVEGNDALRALDPESRDAGYWSGFRRGVMDRAMGELARRREAVRLTIPGVLSGWSRSLIPVSIAAAAVAGFMVLAERASQPDPPPLALEEILNEETEGGAFDAVMDENRDWAVPAFMTLVEGDVR